jgi:LmbE family N-acetylglucosaminyl deacetylase
VSAGERRVAWGADGTVVLAVGAHPDDVETFCGGTLVLLARRGVPVHVATLTAGEAGGARDPEGLRDVRLREAAKAAQVAGAASFHWLGERDMHARAELEQRVRLIDHIRRVGANLVLGHPPGDYHPDHRAAHTLVLEARLAAGVPNVGSGDPLPGGTPDLAYWDNELAIESNPHVWIDVTDAIDTRRDMLRCHESQQVMARGTRLDEVSEALTRLRGQQRGVPFAEGFRHCGVWPHPDGGIRRLVAILEGV